MRTTVTSAFFSRARRHHCCTCNLRVSSHAVLPTENLPYRGASTSETAAQGSQVAQFLVSSLKLHWQWLGQQTAAPISTVLATLPTCSKRIPWLMHKACILQRFPLGMLADVAFVLSFKRWDKVDYVSRYCTIANVLFLLFLFNGDSEDHFHHHPHISGWLVLLHM